MTKIKEHKIYETNPFAKGEELYKEPVGYKLLKEQMECWLKMDDFTAMKILIHMLIDCPIDDKIDKQFLNVELFCEKYEISRGTFYKGLRHLLDNQALIKSDWNQYYFINPFYAHKPVRFDDDPGYSPGSSDTKDEAE